MRRLFKRPILGFVIGFSLLFGVGSALAAGCVQCDTYEAEHDAALADFMASQALITDTTADIGNWFTAMNDLSPVPPIPTFFETQISDGNLMSGADCSGTGYPYYSIFVYDGDNYCNLGTVTMGDFQNAIMNTFGEFPALDPYPTDLYNAYVNLNNEIGNLMDLDAQLTATIDTLNNCYDTYPWCGPCEVDADCGEGYTCQDWVCVSTGGVTCEYADDCPDGYICSDGVCTEENGTGSVGTEGELECETDADCGTYEICIEGSCIDMYCEESGACSAGYICEESMCTESSCTGDSDCETGFSCVLGWCFDLIDTMVSAADIEECSEEAVVCELCDPCPECGDLIDLWNMLNDMADDIADNIQNLMDQIDTAQAELDTLKGIRDDWEKMVKDNGGDVGDDCEDLRNAEVQDMPSGSVWGIAHRFGDSEFCFRNESNLEDFLEDLEEYNRNHPGAKASKDEMDRLQTDIDNMWDTAAAKQDGLDFIEDWLDDLLDEIDDCLWELELCQLLGYCEDEDVEMPEDEGGAEEGEEEGELEPPAEGEGGWPYPWDEGEGFPGYPYPEGPKGEYPPEWPEDPVLCPDCEAVAANLDEAILEYDAILDLIEIVEDEIDNAFESLDDLDAARESDFERIVKEAGGKTGADCDGFTPGPGQASGSYQRFGDIPYCFTTEAQVESFIEKLKEYDDANRENPDTPTEQELTDQIFDLWDLWSELLDVLAEAQEWVEIKAAALDACIELLMELMAEGYCEDSIVPETPELPEGIGAEEGEEEEGFIDIIGHWAKDFIEKLFGEGIISGYEDGTFGPNNQVLRGELTKMGVNAFGEMSRAETPDPGFTDVSVEDWYYEYVAQAKASNCVEGYEDSTFRPLEPVQRVEALKMLLCFAGIDVEAEGIPEADYPDILMDVWYSAYLDYATYKGYVGGYEDGTFGPENSLLRGEISKVLVLIMEDLGLM